MAQNLRVTELDFDLIKTNIKNFLKSRPEFTDYDFEGSGLSVLLDTLAYNTHYNAFYLNMAVNEVFIDSAVKRESVVSLAKMLNYIPRSIKAAQAKINLTVNGVTGSPSSLVIDRYSAFTTVIDGKTYTFYNLEPATIIPSAGVYSYSDLTIKEGTFVVNKFTVGNSPGPAEKFVIPNKNVDTSTIRVTVQPSPTSTSSTTYTLFSGDITGLTGTNQVYFLEQNSLGNYQIYFGDGVLGSILSAGNAVTIEYLVTSGTVANISDKIAQAFELSTSIEGYTDVTITVVEKSSGASEAETIDEIKFNAPRFATSQNRLVTVEDYKNFLKANYNYIDSVSVWGGEDNDTPQFGKVFISIVPKTNQNLTTSRRSQIISDIKSKRTLALTPVFVDPDIFYMVIQDTVKYNPNVTNDSATDIENAVRTAILNYFSQNIVSFGDDFSASKLIAAIDNSKTSILSNSMVPILEKRFNPTAGVNFSQNFKIENKIESETITSTYFYYDLFGEIIKAEIIDVVDTIPVVVTGTYRRSGDVITVNTPLAPHGLLPGERISIQFSGSALDGNYIINTVPTEKSFTIITQESGVDYGTISVTTESRGTLKVRNPDDNRILNNNIGTVAYNSGVVSITNLNIFGFLVDQTDLRLYFKMTRDSEDIFVNRNQILRIDTDTANESVNRLSGISISTLAIPK